MGRLPMQTVVRRLPFVPYTLVMDGRNRRAIELQARVLARVIEGETERYVALTTR